MVKHAVIVSAMVIALAACKGKEASPTPEGASQREIVLKGAPVLIAVGDIAVCGTSGDESTGKLADSLVSSDSAQGVQTLIVTLGDNAYPSGDQGVNNYFQRCFKPSWGDARLMNIIHPSPGNHDYDSGSGAPYFDFFGLRAGPRDRGYYSFDVNGWHLISLNSELYFDAGDPDKARAQEDWLRADLRAHLTQCAIAYFHRPYFSSGAYGTTRELKTIWQILYDGGVDLVLNGHEHDYERFLPQTATGVADATKGMEEIVAGTGGGTLRTFDRPAANSAARIQGRFGVLKVWLGNGEYARAFVTADGTVWDVGGRHCR
ncbi:MAG TPA: metallophosphoesterase [Gemmatimonadaceae bacterium]|nr:metallophosphoesterase [Gemmatimonadaceae bacterium]